MWGSDLSLLSENLCNVIILQFVGCPPRVMGGQPITLSSVCPSYPSRCGSFFMSLVVEDLFW